MTRVTEQASLSRHKTQALDYHGLEYLRTMDEYQGVPRGTAVFGNRTVYGYPSIGRILSLQQGLAEHFDGPFWAEEKVNGYNVRIFKLDGEVIALTRGGFICPFTTDRAMDFLPMTLFEDHPELVVCAEVAGPGNPYIESSPPFIAEDVELFVFDFMRINQQARVGATDKHALIEHYGLPAVGRYGRFLPGDVNALLELLARLNAEEREGLIFKEDRLNGHAAKHVTAASALSDIRATAATLTDLPPEYFTNRILRLVLYLREQKLSHTREMDRELGAAFLEALDEAMTQYEREHKVFHTFRCRFHLRDNAERMFAHLKLAGGRQINVSKRALYAEGTDWILEFDRNYPAINGLFSSVLQGELIFD